MFYDVIVVLIISHNVFSCYKKGFLKSLIFILCSFLGIVVSCFLNKLILKKLLENEVFYEFEKIILKNFKVPKEFEGLAKNFNLGEGFIAKDVIISNLVNIFLSRIIFIILIFIIFFIFRVFRKYLYKMVRIARKMPAIGMLDGILGALCGVLKASIYLIIFSVLCFVLIIITRNELSFLNFEIINSTYLFFLFYKIAYLIK